MLTASDLSLAVSLTFSIMALVNLVSYRIFKVGGLTFIKVAIPSVSPRYLQLSICTTTKG